MRARVQKWGNSLGLRIPKAFAQEAGIQNGSEVEISLIDGRLIISPVIENVPSLEELLAEINEENLHDEIDWGAPMGNEVW